MTDLPIRRTYLDAGQVSTFFGEAVEMLIPEWPALGYKLRREVAQRCATLVRRQIGLAPFHIRVGFQVLFVVYHCFFVLRFFFSTSGRETAITEFSSLPFPMADGLERVLRPATLLFYFEQPEVLAAMGEESIEARQVAFRARRNAMRATLDVAGNRQGME